jgi:hypothetical protein
VPLPRGPPSSPPRDPATWQYIFKTIDLANNSFTFYHFAAFAGADAGIVYMITLCLLAHVVAHHVVQPLFAKGGAVESKSGGAVQSAEKDSTGVSPHDLETAKKS